MKRYFFIFGSVTVRDKAFVRYSRGPAVNASLKVKQEPKETTKEDRADQCVVQISLHALLSWSDGSTVLAATHEAKRMGDARPDMLMIKQIQLALQKDLWDRYTKSIASLEHITLHMNAGKDNKPSVSFKAAADKFCMPFVGDVLITKVPGTVYVGSAMGIPLFVSGSAYNSPTCPLFVPAWFAKEVLENATTSIAHWDVKLFWSIEKRKIVMTPTWGSDVLSFDFVIPILKAPRNGVVVENLTRPRLAKLVRVKTRQLKKIPSESPVVPEKSAAEMVGAGAIAEFNAKIRPAAPETSEPGEPRAAGAMYPTLDKKGRKHLLS